MGKSVRSFVLDCEEQGLIVSNTSDSLTIDGEWTISPPRGSWFVILDDDDELYEGTVKEAGASTLTKESLPFPSGEWAGKSIRIHYESGEATRGIVANTDRLIAVDNVWPSIPAIGSLYEIYDQDDNNIVLFAGTVTAAGNDYLVDDGPDWAAGEWAGGKLIQTGGNERRVLANKSSSVYLEEGEEYSGEFESLTTESDSLYLYSVGTTKPFSEKGNFINEVRKILPGDSFAAGSIWQLSYELDSDSLFTAYNKVLTDPKLSVPYVVLSGLRNGQEEAEFSILYALGWIQYLGNYKEMPDNNGFSRQPDKYGTLVTNYLGGGSLLEQHAKQWYYYHPISGLVNPNAASCQLKIPDSIPQVDKVMLRMGVFVLNLPLPEPSLDPASTQTPPRAPRMGIKRHTLTRIGSFTRYKGMLRKDPQFVDLIDNGVYQVGSDRKITVSWSSIEFDNPDNTNLLKYYFLEILRVENGVPITRKMDKSRYFWQKVYHSVQNDEGNPYEIDLDVSNGQYAAMLGRPDDDGMYEIELHLRAEENYENDEEDIFKIRKWPDAVIRIKLKPTVQSP